MNYIIMPGLKKSLIPDRRGLLSGKIIQAVLDHLLLKREEIEGYRLKGEYSYARQLCMYLLRNHTKLTLNQIGIRFGKDHTTVMHSCNKIEDGIFSNEAIALDVKILNKICESIRFNTN